MYRVGRIVPLTYTVVDAAGNPANASTVTLTIGLPDGTTAAGVTVDNPPTTTGQYQYNYVPTQAGRHTVLWATTGPITTGDDVFNARGATEAIIGLAEARAHLNWSNPNAANVGDDELRDWIEAATEQIEATRGAMAPRTVVETVYPTGGKLALSTVPVLSVTSATLGGVAQDVTGWTVPSALAGHVYPATGSYFYGSTPYVVSYRAGRVPIPAAAIGAVKLFVQHSWETQRGAADLPLADAVEGGGSAFLLRLRAEDLLKAIPQIPVVA